MERSQKEALVAELKQVFAETSLVVVTRQSGMTVAQSSDLRRRMRAAGARYRVAKNRLVKRALDGTQYEDLAEYFTGPTAIAISEDPVAAAKVCAEYAKENSKLEIVGGGLNGQKLDLAGVETLAKLPSLDALRGKLIGVIQAPATKVAGVVQAPAGQLARVFAAYAGKDEAA